MCCRCFKKNYFLHKVPLFRNSSVESNIIQRTTLGPKNISLIVTNAFGHKYTKQTFLNFKLGEHFGINSGENKELTSKLSMSKILLSNIYPMALACFNGVASWLYGCGRNEEFKNTYYLTHHPTNSA